MLTMPNVAGSVRSVQEAQATLVQLKETREDLSEVLATGQGLL